MDNKNRIEKIIGKINRSIIGEEEIDKIIKVLRSGFLSRPAGGPIVDEFQLLMAKIHEKKYAYATTSGTSSLHLAISALELKKDDEVIVPALANIADCSVVLQEGAKPVFADIDSETMNIDPKDIERKITSKTKVIIMVHIYGEPADIKSIREIADRHDLILIEDCAQSGGARYQGKYVGSFGDISCFSFYQTKHIIAGEGGMVLTNSKKWHGIIDSLANNGIKKDNIEAYDYNRIGYNYQMTEIQAALGIVQLGKLDRLNRIRRRNANLYKKIFENIDIVFQKTTDDTENAYFYLTGLLPEYLTEKRDSFLAKVNERGVPIKNLYPLSLPEVELLKGRVPDNCPVAKKLTKRLFNLYVNPGLGKDDIIKFAGIFNKVYKSLDK